jgi:hypothetical protein
MKNEIFKDYLVNYGESAKYFWERFADFVGVELLFSDAQKKVVSKKRYPFFAETHLGLIGTGIWQEYLNSRDDTEKFQTTCQIKIKVPEECVFLKANFLVESRGAVNAGILFSKIALKSFLPAKSPEKGLARIIVRIVDSGTKKILSARIAVRSSTGEIVAPENCIKINSPYPFFYSLTGNEVLDVPPGDYSFEVLKGFEYAPEKTMIQVSEGVEKTVEIPMEKKLDLRKRNWHNGDHHLHLSGHAVIDYPCMKMTQVLEIAEADGMDFIPLQMDFLDTLEHEGECASQGNAIGQYSAELVNHIWGHFCCIYGDKVLKRQICGHILYPTMYDAVKEINASGGYCIAAHPYGMICNPSGIEDLFENMAEGVGNTGRWNCAKELPLILLLGEKCGYDLLATCSFDELKFGIDEYYRLLNFGFRIPVGGSTDTGANSANSLFPACRTFVKSEDFSFPALVEAFRNGKTFATNGPIISASVDGQFDWGDVIVKKKNETLQIELEIFSPWGLSSCEIICNGKIIKEKTLTGEEQLRWTTEIAVEGPSWLAVVAKGPQSRWHRHEQIMHTSPLYIEIHDELFSPPGELVDYYSLWMNQLEKIAKHCKSTRLETDAARIGKKPSEAWDNIMSNINKAREKIKEISEFGWIN